MVRAVLWGILLSWLLRMLQRWISSTAARQQTAGSRRPSKPEPVVLRRDPCCGTYVSPEISFSFEQAGQIEHFCSAACRDRFLRSGRYLRGLQVQPAPDRASA
jgi:YHS domain-containing protein